MSNPGDLADVTDTAAKNTPATTAVPAQPTSSERRRYNRRSASSEEATPPYFEIFSRIASALEGIEHSLGQLALDRDRERSGVGERRR